MSDREFIEQAAIASMQAILSLPFNRNMTATDVAEMSARNAEALLQVLKDKTYPGEYDLMEYIREIDSNHGLYELQLNEKIEQLEMKVANLQRIIEMSSPNWVNHPVTGFKDNPLQPTSMNMSSQDEAEGG